MTSASPPTPPPTTPAGPPRSLSVLLAVLAALVVAQGALAGLMLGGVAQARVVHVVVGWLLPYAAIVPAVVAGVTHSRRACPARLAMAVYPLPVVLWFQEVLGHLPMAWSIALHVPLGVGLAVYAAVVAVLLATAGQRRDGA